MNGRVYDLGLGRFLSPDILVRAPYNSQSFNRYAYVFNNPLSYTDPSGYSANTGDQHCPCGNGGTVNPYSPSPWDNFNDTGANLHNFGSALSAGAPPAATPVDSGYGADELTFTYDQETGEGESEDANNILTLSEEGYEEHLKRQAAQRAALEFNRMLKARSLTMGWSPSAAMGEDQGSIDGLRQADEGILEIGAFAANTPFAASLASRLLAAEALTALQARLYFEVTAEFAGLVTGTTEMIALRVSSAEVASGAAYSVRFIKTRYTVFQKQRIRVRSGEEFKF